MNDDDFGRRLAATDLSTPGITLEEAVWRGAGRARSRRPSWSLRLAAAAAIVWITVFAVQAAVERNLSAVVPPGQSLVAHEAAPSLLCEQKLLLAELMGDGTWSPERTEPSRGETRPAGPDPTEHSRSGSLPIRRCRHV
jgi:hypothetical protein